MSKLLKYHSFKLLKESISTKSRKLLDLINYFELPLNEKKLLIPKWFEDLYPEKAVTLLS